jgi:GTP cyclohydrolase I
VARSRLELAVRLLLEALGEDPDRPELRETPERAAEAFAEMLWGRGQDPREALQVLEEPGAEGLVAVRDLPFYSLCEHHLLPFRGRVHLAYLPREGRIAGLGRLSLLVRIVSRRLQLQERMTREMADALMDALQPEGVLVVVEAEHLCLEVKDGQAAGAGVVTAAARGLLATEPERSRAAALLFPHRDLAFFWQGSV